MLAPTPNAPIPLEAGRHGDRISPSSPSPDACRRGDRISLPPRVSETGDPCRPTSQAPSRRGHIHLEPHILARAAWLPPPDTALLTAYYDAGLTIQRIAQMLNLPPRTTARRVRTLAERISSPRFLAVAQAAHPDPELRALFGPPDPDLWPPTRRRVAAAIHIRGLNMRTAARELRLSLHTVRRHNDAINAILNAAAVHNGHNK